MDQYTAKIITDILHFLKMKSWKAYVFLYTHSTYQLSCAFRLSPL